MSTCVSRITLGLFIALGVFCSVMPPAVADGPSVTYAVAPTKPVAKAPFRVTYELTWIGGLESLGVIPAEPAAVVWGTARLTEAKSYPAADGQRLQYTVEYVAAKDGEVTVPPLALSYVLNPPLEERPKVVAGSDAQPKADPAAVEPISIEAPGFTVTVHKALSPVLVYGGAGAVVVVLGAVVAVLVTRRKRSVRGAAPAEGTTLESLVNAARQHRLDGKFYEYYRELARASTLLAPSIAAKKLRETLEHHAEQVGYGALQPTEDDLEGALRDLERAVRARGPEQN